MHFSYLSEGRSGYIFVSEYEELPRINFDRKPLKELMELFLLDILKLNELSKGFLVNHILQMISLDYSGKTSEFQDATVEFGETVVVLFYKF